MQMKLQENINVTLGGIDQPSTTYLVFGKYLKRNGNTVRMYASYLQILTIKRESLYDIPIKFGVSKKVIRLNKTCLDGTQSKVRIGNYLSSSLLIENGLKQEDLLQLLQFNFALEYAIRKLQETNLRLDKKGIYPNNNNDNNNRKI